MVAKQHHNLLHSYRVMCGYTSMIVTHAFIYVFITQYFCLERYELYIVFRFAPLMPDFLIMC